MANTNFHVIQILSICAVPLLQKYIDSQKEELEKSLEDYHSNFKIQKTILVEILCSENLPKMVIYI